MQKTDNVKQDINLRYIELPKDVQPESGVLKSTINKHYSVNENASPDYILYTNFGYDFSKYDCIRIFHTGECVVPNFNECDYAIGFDRIDFGDRYCRVPLYYFYGLDYEKARHKHERAEVIAAEKREFCSFTVSNDNGQKERKEFFDLLSNYKKVDSGGRYLNNVGGPIKNKFEFDSKHKFSITFENCCHPGYVTEKIVQAFAAGCIPIYFGAPDVDLDFNPKAFIDCGKYQSFDDVINEIKRIDNDDEAYLKMLKEPIHLEEPNFHFEEFICSIIDKPLTEARRRPYNRWVLEYDNRNKRLCRAERMYYKYFKRFKNMLRRIKNGSLKK